MSTLGAVQKYAALAASGKLSAIEDFRKAAVESLMFDVARYQQVCDTRPTPRGGLDLDKCAAYLRSTGFQFSDSQEATINKVRFRQFDKKLHQEFAQLLMDMETYVKRMQEKAARNKSQASVFSREVRETVLRERARQDGQNRTVRQ